MNKNIFWILIFFSMKSFAQVEALPNDNSPYSRFGLGDFVNQNFASTAAMGNLSAAYKNSYFLNVLNPAAASNLVSTSYEIGIHARFSRLEDNVGKSQNTTHGNINYFALGFPLKNQINELFDKRKKSDYKLGMHFALLPYTNVGYDSRVVKDNPVTDSTSYVYRGTGGTYKLLWGNSFAYKGFSLGANIGYLFGKIKSSRQITFDKLVDNYEVETTSNSRYRGFLWNIGTQYTYEFKKINTKGKTEPNGNKLTIGAYGNSATNFNTSTDANFTRTNFSYGTKDTVLLERSNGIEGSGKLPLEVSFGAIYEKGNKFLIGVNYSFAQWSNYRNDAQPEELKDSYRFGVGLEYTPEANSYNKYLRRVRYRLGLNLWSDPRVIVTEQLRGQSVSLGFGMPLVMPRQQVSFVNVTFEAGRFGTEVLEQTYLKCTLGFTLNDNSWFYKRRYN